MDESLYRQRRTVRMDNVAFLRMWRMLRQISQRGRAWSRRIAALVPPRGRRALRWLRAQLDFSIRSLWIMIAFVALLVVVNGVFFSLSVQALSVRQTKVQHSQNVLTDLVGMLSTLDEAETGQRGYLLTGNASYLAPYITAQSRVEPDLTALQKLVRDDPSEDQRAVMLAPLITIRLNEMRQTVQLRQAGQASAAMQIVNTNVGEQTMEQIRQIVGAMETDENTIINQRSAAAAHDLTTVIVTFVLGTLALLVLLLLLGLAAQQMMRQRERLAAERLTQWEGESVARQKAEEAVQLRDDFLSVASHELKTPITAISATAQLLGRRLLRGEDPDPRVRELLDVQTRQTKRLLLLIEGMLDATRIERGQFTLQRAPVELAGLIRPIVAELELMSLKHTIQFNAPAEPIMIDGDAPRLEQVWYNLLQNALKYSPDGGLVTITLARERKRAVITITDQGIGIPADALPRLFDPYFRAANTKNRRINGMGVGLHVTKAIITQHGGTITVKSTEGVGSIFTVRLPLPVPQKTGRRIAIRQTARE
jgi:signal transduction histidine kinase